MNMLAFKNLLKLLQNEGYDVDHASFCSQDIFHVCGYKALDISIKHEHEAPYGDFYRLDISEHSMGCEHLHKVTGLWIRIDHRIVEAFIPKNHEYAEYLRVDKKIRYNRKEKYYNVNLKNERYASFPKQGYNEWR